MRLSLMVLSSALVAITLSAHASTIGYTSSAGFSAASSTTSYGFSGVPAGGFAQVSNPYSIGPLTFGNSAGDLYIANDGSYGTGQLYLAASPTAGESIQLGGATALAFDIGTYDAATNLTFAINGLVFNFNTPDAMNPIFVGFTSDTPITSLLITSADPEIDILDFKAGSANASTAVTPEPSSFLLLGTGILGAVGVMRRKFAA